MAYPFNSYFKPRMISTPDPGFRFTPRQPIRQYKELSPGETNQYSYAPLTSICPATYTTMQPGTPQVYQGMGGGGFKCITDMAQHRPIKKKRTPQDIMKHGKPKGIRLMRRSRLSTHLTGI